MPPFPMTTTVRAVSSLLTNSSTLAESRSPMTRDQLRADTTADAQLVIGESVLRGGAVAARIVAESYISYDIPIMNHNHRVNRILL